jgi:hypothetical protein
MMFRLALTSREASIVPVMAVVAAVSHIAIGPIISRFFHVPGPTLAGPVIMAPIMVAGAVTQRRGALLLTTAINGLILSLFVPIGWLAFPIYVIVGLVLELLYSRSLSKLYSSPSFSFFAGGTSNAVSIILIAVIAIGMKAMIPLAIITIVGYIAGGIGGLIATAVTVRVRHMYPAKAQ